MSESTSYRKHAVAVTFTWGEVGDLHVARYARLESAIIIDGDTFEPAPEIFVEPAEIEGGVNFKAWKLSMLLTRSPFTTLCRPYSHAPVDVDIAEFNPDLPDTTYRLWYRGRLLTTSRNDREKRGLVTAEIVGPKRRLDTPLGMPCTSGCIHTFGDRYCGYDVPQHNITIATIDGETVTFSGYTPPRSTYFRNGELRADGLRMSVLRQINDTTLRLERRPPPEWVGLTVTAKPGCDKQADGDCTVFDNRCRFLGPGFSMPTHNPILESQE